MLELAAVAGEIDLKYLDESGFCAWSEPGYTYYQQGEQKRLEQTLRRGRRLSIIGLLQPLNSFVYGLVIGGVGRKSYIQMMEQEAPAITLPKSTQPLNNTRLFGATDPIDEGWVDLGRSVVALSAEKAGRSRVIVQDNGPIHRCKEVKQLWSKWESQGLHIFFLPKYCSEMNPIELEWQHLKKDELSGQVFDDELELAYAVIDGVEARGKRGNYSTERIKFSSNRSG